MIKFLVRPFWPVFFKIIVKLLNYKSLKVTNIYESVEGYRTKLLSKDNINIIDCGIGVGNYIEKLTANISNYKIHGIDAHNLSIAQSKIKFNNNSIINLHNVGLWSKKENKDLYVYAIPENNSLFQINKDIIPNVKFIDLETIKCTTLDDFIIEHNLSIIELLHIDTNGSEYDILLGSKQILKKQYIRIIELEYVMSNVYNDIESISNILVLLEKYNYKLKKIFIRHMAFSIEKVTIFFMVEQ